VKNSDDIWPGSQGVCRKSISIICSLDDGLYETQIQIHLTTNPRKKLTAASLLLEFPYAAPRNTSLSHTLPAKPMPDYKPDYWRKEKPYLYLQ
jgi:hypothetical protein